MINYVKNEKQDHFDTPAYAVVPLLQYIKPEWTVWEPTDTYGNSQIAESLRVHGCRVISSSKKDIDFLTDKPDFLFDCIVTNPPYSLKDKFIRRCYELSKHWAMLMPITALEGIERGKMWREYGIELLVFDKRVEYIGESSYFNSSWFTFNVLPEPLLFVNLDKRVSCNESQRSLL